MAQVGEDGGSCVLSYIEFLNSLILDLSFYQELENLRILSSVLMLYNELRYSDGFILLRSSQHLAIMQFFMVIG